MFALVVAIVLLMPLALLATLALASWLQITRDLIGDEGDEEDRDAGAAPAITPELEQALWRERSLAALPAAENLGQLTCSTDGSPGRGTRSVRSVRAG